MKIRTFTAQTEQEAMSKVLEELGANAIVTNIKKTQPKGFFAFFRKPSVTVIAAYDENKPLPKEPPASVGAEFMKNLEQKAPPPRKPSVDYKITGEDAELARLVKGDSAPNLATKEEFFGSEMTSLMKEITISEQDAKIKELEKQLASKQDAITTLARHLKKADKHKGKYKIPVLSMFYETMRKNGVNEETCAYILDEIDEATDIDRTDVNAIVKIVYASILKLLDAADEPIPVKVDKRKQKAQVYAFIGPTGVGKTTTIAKIAANYALNKQLNVGLITADTYRIAAVEQLKLYADILGADIGVVYDSEGMDTALQKCNGVNDVILVDTAGRSHRNVDVMEELEKLLTAFKDDDNCQIFLILSLATKYDDLIAIIETYSKFCAFRLIFTKLDETAQIGAMLNIIYKTGLKVAYLTTGQNVPQDIDILRPDMIARNLLGLLKK